MKKCASTRIVSVINSPEEEESAIKRTFNKIHHDYSELHYLACGFFYQARFGLTSVTQLFITVNLIIAF